MGCNPRLSFATVASHSEVEIAAHCYWVHVVERRCSTRARKSTYPLPDIRRIATREESLRPVKRRGVVDVNLASPHRHDASTPYRFARTVHALTATGWRSREPQSA